MPRWQGKKLAILRSSSTKNESSLSLPSGPRSSSSSLIGSNPWQRSHRHSASGRPFQPNPFLEASVVGGDVPLEPTSWPCPTRPACSRPRPVMFRSRLTRSLRPTTAPTGTAITSRFVFPCGIFFEGGGEGSGASPPSPPGRVLGRGIAFYSHSPPLLT